MGELKFRAGRGDASEPSVIGGVGGASDAFGRHNGQRTDAPRGGKEADAGP